MGLEAGRPSPQRLTLRWTMVWRVKEMLYPPAYELVDGKWVLDKNREPIASLIWWDGDDPNYDFHQYDYATWLSPQEREDLMADHRRPALALSATMMAYDFSFWGNLWDRKEKAHVKLLLGDDSTKVVRLDRHGRWPKNVTLAPRNYHERLIVMRNYYRRIKNWAMADRLRLKLEALGFTIEDQKFGTFWYAA